MQPALGTAFSSTWSRRPKDLLKAPRIRLEEGARGLSFLRREFRNFLMVLGGLVALLLAIACTNIANLLLARATAKDRKIAMRVSFGCSRSRLMRHFLTESALLTAIGGFASIAVAYLTANLLGRFLAVRNSFLITVGLDWHTLAIVGVTSALALLLFGLFPAWRGARIPNAAWLKEGAGSIGTAARRKLTAGRVLVLIQMAMSVVLVLSAVVFTRNLIGIESADSGFDRRNLILFGIRPGTSGYDKSRLEQFYLNLSQRLSATPGVAPVIAATSMKELPFAVWLPLGKDTSEVTVVLRTLQLPQRVLQAVRTTMREIDRNLPLVDVTTMEEQISKTMQRERMFATLCDSFGILALVLSVVGLYGVVSYNTSRRQGEIGIRLSLGAVPRYVLVIILVEGLRLIVAGVLIGVPPVWLGAKYVEKELFQMKPLELGSVSATLSILLTAALVAVAIPTIRASALRPSDTLRQE